MGANRMDVTDGEGIAGAARSGRTGGCGKGAQGVRDGKGAERKRHDREAL